MNVQVTKDNVIIIEDSNLPHENEYKITKCYFSFDEFTKSFQVKRAIFTILSTGEMYETDIIDNECYVPIEVLRHELETIKLGVYSFDVETIEENGKEEQVLKQRTSPSYTTFVVPSGSYEEGALSPEIITPSQYDIYSQALQEGLSELENGLEEVSHVDIDASKSGSIATVTITNRYNQEKSVDINDGYTPIKGVDYFTTSEIEQIERETKEQVKIDLDFDNTISGIEQEIQDLNSNKASKTELESETNARELADANLQEQIDAITSSKDVVDIVATYSDLQNYNTSTLTEDDVIKVLNDSTHNNAMSYYRWTNNTWNYIGSEGPFYTKSETDSLLNTKQSTIDSSHKLSSDLIDDTDKTNKFTNTNEKNIWNAKYDKPSIGIPKSDLSQSVQESLDKADSAIQDVSEKEDKSNKVTEINSSSTDTQYPSAKCVYDSQVAQDNEIDNLKMIYNILPTDNDSGESISLSGTGEMPIKNIKLGGNTSQEVISGESGTNANATSISISDVNTSKEHYFGIQGNTNQTTTTGKNKYGITSAVPRTYGSSLPTGDTQNLVIDSYDLNNIEFHTRASGNYLIALLPTFQLEPNTSYTLTYTRTNTLASGASARRYIYSVDNDNNYAVINSLVDGDSGDKTHTFTTTATGKVAIAFGYLNNASINSSKVNNLMLRLSSDTSATFEPFTYGASPNPQFEQNIEVVTGENTIVISNSDNSQSQSFTINLSNIELCKISTYKDKIYKNDDKWYLEKNINKIVLNGEESWYTYNNIMYLESVNDYLKAGNVNVPYSNYYKGGAMRSGIGTITSDNKNTIALSNNASATFFRLFVNDDRGLSVEQFETWLSMHNVIVYYILATPTITEITDSTLVTQLNALASSTLYETTNVNTNTSNLLPYIDLQYNVVTASPSPSRPSIVNVVKGENTITIANSDNTQNQTYQVNLPSGLELCKISTYQDYFYKDNGNWYKHSEIGKTTDTIGSTSITIDNMVSNGGMYSYYGGTLSGKTITYDSALLHDNVIYYPLTTPINTQITDTTLINQLNTIKNAHSYDDETNITQTNNDKAFIIDVEMFLNLKNVLS